MSVTTARVVLWLNLIVPAIALALLWHVCADPVGLAQLFPSWSAPETWLDMMLALHLGAAWLLVLNLGVYMWVQPGAETAATHS